METTEQTTSKELIEAWAAEHGVTMQAVFVPFSQSRNKGEKSPSLNWMVTIQKSGLDILTTDYGMGCGHCPSYKQRPNTFEHAAMMRECEGGKIRNGTPILPSIPDVLHSLSMDADVIDAGDFEGWAIEFGYDTDSRKAEALYRTCLGIALKLRAALGDAALTELREACQDY